MSYQQKQLDNISKGDVILTRVRKVKGGKVDFEFAEIVETPSAQRISDGGFAQLGNFDDERFNTTSARRAWQGVTPAGAKRLFPQLGEQIDEVAGGELYDIAEINMLNPTCKNEHGEMKPVHVQVIEELRPDSLDQRRIAKEGIGAVAKQDGNGNFLLTEDDQFIFSHTRPVLLETDEFEHTFIPHAKMSNDPVDGHIAKEYDRGDIVGDSQQQEEPATEQPEEVTQEA